MKRLPFKTEFVPLVLGGTKTSTIRKGTTLNVGDIVTAVHTPPPLRAEFPFATIEITKVTEITLGDITEEMAKESGVTRQWYTDKYGDDPSIQMVKIEFKQVKE